MSDFNNTIKTTVELDANQAAAAITKLNGIAADTTLTLEERIEAKNKAVELQNKLSRDAVKLQEVEVKRLKDLGAEEKKVEAAVKKLNKAKLDEVKASVKSSKEQKKLATALVDSKDSVKGLDDATGGLLGKFKLLLANPIGIAIAAIAAVFTLFSKAVKRSGKASETFSKIGAKLSGFFNGLLAIITPVVEFIGEKFLFALENPLEAIKELGRTIKENIINRFEALFILGDAISELFKGNFSNAAKLAGEGFLQLATGVEDVTEKIKAFAEEAVENYTKAAEATENLANKERRLLANRQALEKQQLLSLRMAEEQRQIRDDVSKSMDERIAANKELGRILEDQAKIEMALAQQSLDIAQMEVAASGETIENLEAVGDAELKLLEIQERITGQRSEQLVNENSLLIEKQALKDEELAKEAEAVEAKKELAVRDAEAQLEIDALKLEAKRAAGEDVLALELELLNRQREQELSNADLTGKEKELITAKYADAEAALVKISEDSKAKAAKESKEQSIAAAAEAFGISQELAVGQMIMAAPEAIAGSFKEAAKKYAPPFSIAMGALGAAGTVAPIIKGLADIKKVRFPAKGKSKRGGSGGGGSISSSAGSSGGSAGASITPELIGDIASNNAARLGQDTELGNSATAAASNNVAGGASPNVTFSEGKYNDFQNQVGFKEDKTTIG